MAELYVSTAGSDTNNGTENSPLRTIRAASQLAQPGTTVHVASGTYFGGFVTSASALTHCADSQGCCGVRIWLDGTDSMRACEHAGQAVAGGDHEGSQPAVQTHRTGAGHSRLGRWGPGAADRHAGRRQPANGPAGG